MDLDEKYTIISANDPEPFITILEDKLYEHNSNSIERFDGTLFCKYVKDKDGQLLAGIAGWTWAAACEISQLWVSEAMRNKGIGKRLLLAAEEDARKKNCFTILIRSYSFQAPEFYEKNGYKIEHIIENFPNGYRYFFLKKLL